MDFTFQEKFLESISDSSSTKCEKMRLGCRIQEAF